MDISLHAMERYVERTKNKDNKTDIALYIGNRREDIIQDINKMVEYGTLIFTGRSISEYNKNIVDVYLKDTWVIIVDKDKQKVITLYSIDLGLGKEFNDQYISLMKEKLDKANEVYESEKLDIVKRQAEYEEAVKTNNEVIADCKKTIKALEEQNQMYNDLIDSLRTNMEVAEKDVRDIVAIFTGRKVF